jgi:hypothetical protein
MRSGGCDANMWYLLCNYIRHLCDTVGMTSLGTSVHGIKEVGDDGGIVMVRRYIVERPGKEKERV